MNFLHVLLEEGHFVLLFVHNLSKSFIFITIDREGKHVFGRGNIKYICQSVRISKDCFGHVELLCLFIHLLQKFIDEGAC
jgi:hypothetical protein